MLCLCFGGNNAHFRNCGIAGLEGAHLYLVDTDQQVSIPDMSVSVLTSGVWAPWFPPLPCADVVKPFDFSRSDRCGWYLMVLIKAFFKNTLCYTKTRLPHTWSSFFY